MSTVSERAKMIDYLFVRIPELAAYAQRERELVDEAKMFWDVKPREFLLSVLLFRMEFHIKAVARLELAKKIDAELRELRLDEERQEREEVRLQQVHSRADRRTRNWLASETQGSVRRKQTKSRT